jgi:hypothetical protein
VSQFDGTTSMAQIVTIKNPGNSVVNLLIALSGDEDYVPMIRVSAAWPQT